MPPRRYAQALVETQLSSAYRLAAGDAGAAALEVDGAVPPGVAPAPALSLRLAAGEPAALGELERVIGQALAGGQLDLALEAYLDLAAGHLGTGATRDAGAALEEALDVQTLGDGAAGDTGPRDLWRLLVELARLHRAARKPDRALEAAGQALRHAHRAGSLVGEARAEALLCSLSELARDAPAAAGHPAAAMDARVRLAERRLAATALPRSLPAALVVGDRDRPLTAA